MSDPYDPRGRPEGIPPSQLYPPRAPIGSDELLIRIDERTRAMAEEMKGLKEIIITRAEFAPVRMIAYGLVGLILTLVVTALVASLVVRGK
jgi:ATP sulfurylase